MRLRLWIQRGKTTGVKCSFHHIRSRPLTDIALWPLTLALFTCSKLICQVSPLQSDCFSPFHTLCFGKTSLSTYRMGNFSPLLIAKGLHKLVGILLHGRDSQVPIYLFIWSLYQYGLKDINFFTLDYYLLLLLFFFLIIVAQIVPTLAIGSSFSWLLCSFYIPQLCRQCCFKYFFTFCTTKCHMYVKYIHL